MRFFSSFWLNCSLRRISIAIHSVLYMEVSAFNMNFALYSLVRQSSTVALVQCIIFRECKCQSVTGTSRPFHCVWVCLCARNTFSFSFCHIFVTVNSIGYIFIKMFWAKNERPWRIINHNVCFILAAECPNRTHTHSSAHIFWLNSHFIFVLFLISINSSW